MCKFNLKTNFMKNNNFDQTFTLFLVFTVKSVNVLLFDIFHCSKVNDFYKIYYI